MFKDRSISDLLAKSDDITTRSKAIQDRSRAVSESLSSVLRECSNAARASHAPEPPAPELTEDSSAVKCVVMPWRCPACQLAITHSPSEGVPRAGAIYRCHVCRIELAVDPTTKRLVAAPISAHEENERPQGRTGP